MKKVLVIFALVLLVFAVAGCVDRKDEKINVYLPDGAPALALAYMMENYTEVAGKEVTYTVVPSNTIAAYVSNGSADMAIMPTNAAVNVFNAGNDISMISVNTFGNLYMVSGEDYTSTEELKGKVIAVIGQAQTPDLVLRSVLAADGIEVAEGDEPQEGKVTILYADDGGAAIGFIVAGKVDAALLGEPAVTTAMKKTGGKIVFDLQEEWQRVTGFEGYPQACLIAYNSLPGYFIEQFVKGMEEGVGFVEENPERAVELITQNMLEGTEPSITSLTRETAVRCNVGMQKASEAKDSVEKYIAELGLSINKDGFFYGL